MPIRVSSSINGIEYITEGILLERATHPSFRISTIRNPFEIITSENRIRLEESALDDIYVNNNRRDIPVQSFQDLTPRAAFGVSGIRPNYRIIDESDFIQRWEVAKPKPQGCINYIYVDVICKPIQKGLKRIKDLAVYMVADKWIVKENFKLDYKENNKTISISINAIGRKWSI